MKKKKLAGIVCLILALTLLLAACSQSTAKTSSASSKVTSYVAPVASTGTLTLIAAMNDNATTNIMTGIVNGFHTLNPKITINIIPTTANAFDTVMQVRVAANDVPDIMWSSVRVTTYDNVQLDLSNEPWVANVVPDYLPAIKDKAGLVKVLPVARGISGISYNLDILNQYGINPDTTLKTVDSWIADMKIIKDKSNGAVESFFIGNADGQLQLFTSYLGDGAFINGNTKNGPAFLNGTFDWSQWTAFASKINSMTPYFNANYLTAKQTDALNAYAQGKAVFYWGQDNTSGLKALNPNINLGYVPIPAWTSSTKPYFVSDVRDAYSISNTSKNIDDARLFLDFAAQEQNIDELAVVGGFVPCFKGYNVTTFDMTRLATFSDAPYITFFNNFLPKGFGSYMTLDGAALATGSMTAQGYTDDLKAQYLRSFAQASSTT